MKTKKIKSISMIVLIIALLFSLTVCSGCSKSAGTGGASYDRAEAEMAYPAETPMAEATPAPPRAVMDDMKADYEYTDVDGGYSNTASSVQSGRKIT